MSDFVRITSPPYFSFLFTVSDDISLQTVPKELTQTERDIIVSRFKGLREAGETRFFDFYLPGKPRLFIKHGDDVLAEARTQSFFCAKVFDAFCQQGYCFFVMENPESLQHSRNGGRRSVASAVKWLLDQLPLAPDSVFGRISSESGARVWHQFFKDHQAPVPFANSEGFLKYVLRISPLTDGSLLNRFFPVGIYALPEGRATIHLCCERALDLFLGGSIHLPLRHQQGQLPHRHHDQMSLDD